MEKSHRLISPLHLGSIRALRIYYPRSFLKLLAIGFTLVALPLVIAIINNAISIDQIVNRSQAAVYSAAQATQRGRQLAELLTAMERSARQMAILGDRALLESYALNRQEFQATAAQFNQLPSDTVQTAAVKNIVRGEAGIYAVLSDESATPAELQNAMSGFSQLADNAQAVIARSNELIDRQVEAMRATAAQARRVTLWQLLALIPVVAFLVTGFIIWIARPIRQIDAAIRRLGAGEFSAPVEVRGPEDLQYLGERLEWMRRRLVDLEDQKNRFLRQVSHELKTPLTALRVGAELLADESVDKLSTQQREITTILCHSSLKLQTLIETLLSYAAIRFQRATLELQPVDIRRVINRVADDQKLALRAKNIQLAITAEGVTLMADFEKLRVVLDNLLSNAIKFSPPGGAISIAAHADDAHLELDVADRGPGIALADRGRVFDPFFQGAQVASGMVKGTGIGLSIVKEYAQEHGGTVEVIERGGEPGALLRVRVPLAREERAS